MQRGWKRELNVIKVCSDNGHMVKIADPYSNGN